MFRPALARVLGGGQALVAVLAFALGVAQAGITDGVRKEVLPNGLTLLVLENHKAPVATLNVFYRVGSRNEQVGRTGLSHLVEHLMFRGTKKLAPEEFSNIIQQNGGTDNAFTTADYTDYFEVINHQHVDVPIQLEADRMANFDPKGFDSEKAVVMEERRLRTEDDPEDALVEVTQAQAYLEHPYHWPVIGWMNDLRRLTLKDALDYHARYYVPANAVLVAVGDFRADEVLAELSRAFGSVPAGALPPKVTEVEPRQEGARRVVLRHAANLPAVVEAFHVPNYRSEKDSYALEIAAEILSDGRSSRLYHRLVLEKRLVVSVSASYDMTSFDPGIFWVAAQPRPGVTAAQVLNAIDREVDNLRRRPPGALELQKARNLEQAGFVFRQDSILEEAMLLGLYQLLGDYHMVDRYLENIERVGPGDVLRAARSYLVASNLTVGVLVPTGVLPHEASGGGGAVR